MSEGTLAEFIERYILGWPKNFRRYEGDSNMDSYENDEQWAIHLERLEKKFPCQYDKLDKEK